MGAQWRIAALAAGLGLATTWACVPPPPQGQLDALRVLDSIPIAVENGVGYDRDLFHYPSDLDGDHCDTRAEVLLRDTFVPVVPVPGACEFTGGRWHSAYDGITTEDATALEIDHVVALKEAWDSGAFAWDETRRVAFGNDLTDVRSLAAVTSTSNRAKGDQDPATWLPPLPAAVCPFIGSWIAIKARWGLSMDEAEHERIRDLLGGACIGLVIDGFTPAAKAHAHDQLSSDVP